MQQSVVAIDPGDIDPVQLESDEVDRIGDGG